VGFVEGDGPRARTAEVSHLLDLQPCWLLLDLHPLESAAFPRHTPRAVAAVQSGFALEDLGGRAVSASTPAAKPRLHRATDENRIGPLFVELFFQKSPQGKAT
jgi:hypothetical protein